MPDAAIRTESLAPNTPDVCYLCAGPLVDSNCPAYHWHDKTHLENRARLDGKAAEAVEAAHVSNPSSQDIAISKLCMTCGAPLDADGVNCTAVNAPWHDEYVPGMEGFFDAHFLDEHFLDDKPLFHTQAEAVNAPPVTFLIKDFLQREGVSAIAAPVRERKSLIALNVAHALLTGQKLFDHFEVVKRPVRVIYLCPEVSLGPFMDRVKKIGLIDYVGWKFLCRTLSSDGRLGLNDAELLRVLPYSVVILDTAIRFLEGDENSSQDVRAFADSLFALLKNGAEAVLMLHHSPKDSGEYMSLESAMRGSGDLGALLCCCWGTKLQDPARPYESASFLSNLKQRDFESKDFEVTCGADLRMHIIGDGTRIAELKSRKGKPANKDGNDAAAETFIRANMAMPIRELQEQLAGLNIKRGTTWIARVRARLKIEESS